MSLKRDKQQIGQMKAELKAAQKSYRSKARSGQMRLIKLALVMVILAVIAGVVTGRIPMPKW